jgi:hypothetical protein
MVGSCQTEGFIIVLDLLFLVVNLCALVVNLCAFFILRLGIATIKGFDPASF